LTGCRRHRDRTGTGQDRDSDRTGTGRKTGRVNGGNASIIIYENGVVNGLVLVDGANQVLLVYC
jgi:hypothetical protein